MRNRARLLPALLLAIAGCSASPPTLDTSSDAAFRASSDAITDRMDEPKKEQFSRAVAAATMPAMMKKAFGGAGKADASDLREAMKPYHGMTGDQIIEKAGAKRAP